MDEKVTVINLNEGVQGAGRHAGGHFKGTLVSVMYAI